ncbi:MAG: trypsin-like peptidase domain-containing protein [Leptospiraceae bacterium]|nr:trypsin-like peptidase domain-containing protein [Leptospiraceae bacterium]MDW7975515.1 trypsin-like peptidase domain-containing protein [Leptospiraceae bacterium]
MKKIQVSRYVLVNLLFAAFLLGTFFSPLFYSGFKQFWKSGTLQTNADPIPASDQISAVEIEKTFMNVYNKAQPSVVYIKTNILVRPHAWFDFYHQVEGAGSGVIIDKEGYIVTNSHVVKGASVIEVYFSDDTRAIAKLVGRDENSDIALIKVPASDKLQPAVLGDSDKVKPGQLVFALGSPYGLARTFTFGIVSAVTRYIDNTKYSRIQTDASINPGNSGGPLLNIYGEVIGINQSIISPDGKGGSVGIGFAIPINEIKETIEILKKEKRVIGKAALGISVAEVNEGLKEYLGIPRDQKGVVVRFVVPGSSADKAGIQENDFIYKLNDQNIESTEDLVRAIQRAGIGAEVELHIIRKGNRIKIKAIVGEDLS